MSPSAWQVLCGLEAWLVTQVARRSARQEPGGAGDEGDLLAVQRATALGAAYHGGGGPVGFAWVRDRAGGPVHVVAAGRALAAAGGGPCAALKLPAGGRGEALGASGLARMLAALPCWVRVAGVADSLLAGDRQAPGSANSIRPSLEDGLLAAWPGAFAWLVLAEPVGRAELEDLTFQVYAAQGAAQRFDNPQAQMSVRRLQDRHAELRQAASAGLWRVRVLAGAAGGVEAGEVAGLLCASSDLAGLPYGLVPVRGFGSLDRALEEGLAARAAPRDMRAAASMDLEAWRPHHGPPVPQPAAGGLEGDPEPASPFYGSSAVLAALARPPAREIPGSARFVLRPEFDTIPETSAVVAEPGIKVGELLDRERAPAGVLTLPRGSLNRHTFVSGATGAGKSQTVRSLSGDGPDLGAGSRDAGVRDQADEGCQPHLTAGSRAAPIRRLRRSRDPADHTDRGLVQLHQPSRRCAGRRP